ncbi:hypothetical protein [Salinibaculum rarum]|uniref:hypothetical protein n=1 Tax=Salinibaculum rarum TaxID=3058903 RepID=UPI00265F949D|nr:hypothetical protein [Salinibaculum sp. KK48]
MAQPKLSYWTVQPDRFTFGATKLRNWVESRLEGEVLNACCGPTELDYDSVHRNDLNEELTLTIDGEQKTFEIDADTYHDVRELNEKLETQFDVIVYDPPFTANQAESSYGCNVDAGYDRDVTEVLDALLKPGGKVLQFGYTTTMFAEHDGFCTTEVALFNTLGRMDDWFATVIEKQPPTSPNTDAAPATRDVVPNADACGDIGGATTSGNDGDPITVEYHRLSRDTNLEHTIGEHVTKITAPPTLHIAGRGLDVKLPSTNESLALTSDVDANHHFDERAVASSFSETSFDTVVFSPQREVFQHQLEYKGAMRGRDAVIKEEFEPLVAPAGKVIQVAQTATCMPGRFNYTRDHIAIFAHPTAPHDILVTVDEAPSALSPNGLLDPDASGVRESAADSRYKCLHCGQGNGFPKAYDVDCLECGAHPGNYCLTPDGKIRREPHAERREAAAGPHEAGECVPATATAVRPHVSPTDGHSAQTGLEAFTATSSD